MKATGAKLWCNRIKVLASRELWLILWTIAKGYLGDQRARRDVRDMAEALDEYRRAKQGGRA